MKSVGCDCQDCVAFLDRGAVDDLGSFNDARDARSEDVNSVINDERLDRGLAADKRAVVVAACIRDSFDKSLDSVLFCVTADDGIEDSEGLCTHDDDVIYQMVDHVMTDRFGVAVFDRELLFRARLLGFKDEDGFLYLRELDVVK